MESAWACSHSNRSPVNWQNKPEVGRWQHIQKQVVPSLNSNAPAANEAMVDEFRAPIKGWFVLILPFVMLGALL